MTKILVEVVGPNNIVLSRKRRSFEGDKLIIEKPDQKKGLPGYIPQFSKDSILTFERGIGPFKSLKRKVILVDGAEKAIEWFNSSAHEVDPNLPDRATIKRIFAASVLSRASQSMGKMQAPLALYIASFGSLGLTFVILMVITGRMRF